VPRSDDYRYQGGSRLPEQAVRADYADTVVWDHVTPCSPTPASSAPRSAKGWKEPDLGPVTKAASSSSLAKTGTSIAAMITAFSEQLLTIDELRPHAALAPGDGPEDQLAALDAQAAGRDAYLTLAATSKDPRQAPRSAATATVKDRQRVCARRPGRPRRPGKITIATASPSEPSSAAATTTNRHGGDMRDSSLLRWGVTSPLLSTSPCRSWTSTSPGTGRPGVHLLGTSQARVWACRTTAWCVRRRLDDHGRGHQERRAGPREEAAQVLARIGLHLSKKRP